MCQARDSARSPRGYDTDMAKRTGRAGMAEEIPARLLHAYPKRWGSSMSIVPALLGAADLVLIQRPHGLRMTIMNASAKLTAVGTLAACAGAVVLPSALAASTTTVTLKDISFKKATVHIAKGASVKWVWDDGPSPHNVTFARRHSGTKKTGVYVLRFAKAGTYRYHCTLHPGMDGKVIVR